MFQSITHAHCDACTLLELNALKSMEPTLLLLDFQSNIVGTASMGPKNRKCLKRKYFFSQKKNRKILSTFKKKKSNCPNNSKFNHLPPNHLSGLGYSQGRGPRQPEIWTQILALGMWNVTQHLSRRLREVPTRDSRTHLYAQAWALEPHFSREAVLSTTLV